MEFIFIILSWMILLVPGFDDSVPPTDSKIFKIETSPDIVQSIKIQSDASFDLWGFDIVLKQNSTGTLDIMIPKNLPTPASFIGEWSYGRAFVLVDGVEINYDIIDDPCYSYYKIPIDGKTNLEIVYSVITAGTWQLYSPIQFDENHPCYKKVFYEKPRDSPLKQYKSGIPIDQIQCKEGFVISLKASNGNPNCVKRESLEKLRERGWAEPVSLLETQFEEIKYDIEQTGYDICNIKLEENKIIIDLNWIFKDSPEEKEIISKIPSFVNYQIVYYDGYTDYFIGEDTANTCETLKN